MFAYKLTDERPLTPSLAWPPLFGAGLLTLLFVFVPFKWAMAIIGGLLLVSGVALYFLGMARTVAVLDEMSRDGEG